MQSNDALQATCSATEKQAPSPTPATSKQPAPLPSLKGSPTEEWIANSLIRMQEVARNPDLLSQRKLRSF